MFARKLDGFNPRFSDLLKLSGEALAGQTSSGICPQTISVLTEEIASLGVYLASDESAFVTGGLHLIDGGWTL